MHRKAVACHLCHRGTVVGDAIREDEQSVLDTVVK